MTALIIRQVGNRWQARLPGNILVKEFKYRWDAYKFKLTKDEIKQIMDATFSYKKNIKEVSPDKAIDELASPPVKTITELTPPEGIKPKELTMPKFIPNNKKKDKK